MLNYKKISSLLFISNASYASSHLQNRIRDTHFYLDILKASKIDFWSSSNLLV